MCVNLENDDTHIIYVKNRASKAVVYLHILYVKYRTSKAAINMLLILKAHSLLHINKEWYFYRCCSNRIIYYGAYLAAWALRLP